MVLNTLLFDAGMRTWSALMANSVCRRSSEYAITLHPSALPTMACACPCSGPSAAVAAAWGMVVIPPGAGADAATASAARMRAASEMALARVP